MEMTASNPQTCPVCGVKILVGMVGGVKLYARVCRYVEKPGCINKDGGSQGANPKDY
jgi:hypothetical protein